MTTDAEVTPSRPRRTRRIDRDSRSGSAPAAASSRSFRPTPSPRCSANAPASTCEIVVIKTSGDRLAEAPLSRDRRQAAVREGDRGRAARRRGRSRGPQQQGHARASCPTGSRLAPCCRARIRATRSCCPARLEQVTAARSRSWWRGSATRPASARAASGGRRSSRGCFRAQRSCRFAAISDTRLRKAGRRRLRRDRAGRGRASIASSTAPASRRCCRSDAACRRRARASSPSKSARATQRRRRTRSQRSTIATAAAALDAERAVVTELGGGCQMPIGAYAAGHDGDDHARSRSCFHWTAHGRFAQNRAGPMTRVTRRLGRRRPTSCWRKAPSSILADVQRAHAAVEGIQP